MIAWNKGKTKAEFPQLSRSGVKKGNKPWNKGEVYLAPWLDEFRYKKGQGAPRKGMKTSDSHKSKLSKAAKKLDHSNAVKAMKNWAINNPKEKEQNRIKGMMVLAKRRVTKPEQALKDLLSVCDINHVSQYLVNDKFLVDEYLPKSNTVIEVDGRYWHTLDRVKKKDKAENAYLKKCGYKVIRVWEDEISRLNYFRC